MNVVDKRGGGTTKEASPVSAGETEEPLPNSEASGVAPRVYERTSGKNKCRYCGRRDFHTHNGEMPRVVMIEDVDPTQHKHPLAGVPLTRATRRLHKIKQRKPE